MRGCSKCRLCVCSVSSVRAPAAGILFHGGKPSPGSPVMPINQERSFVAVAVTRKNEVHPARFEHRQEILTHFNQV